MLLLLQVRRQSWLVKATLQLRPQQGRQPPPLPLLQPSLSQTSKQKRKSLLHLSLLVSFEQNGPKSKIL